MPYASLVSWIMITMVLSCANYQGQSELPEGKAVNQTQNSRMIYVNATQAAQIKVQSDTVEVPVSGNLPSPAYQFERFDVKVSRNIIRITPLAHYDSERMAAQMLVPFEQVCIVNNLRPGSYDIEIHGRGEVVKAGSVRVE